MGRPGDFAHEFGHILGLHDNYDASNLAAGPIAGQQENLMTRAQGFVTQEMVDRVIRRSGMVDDDKILCAWSVSSKGTSVETIGASTEVEWFDSVSVDIEGMKLIAAADGSVNGFGTMKWEGRHSMVSSLSSCTSPIPFSQSIISASGTLVGGASGALLRLTLRVSEPYGAMQTVCIAGTDRVLAAPAQPYGDRYGWALGEFDLPATGGMVAIAKTKIINLALSVEAAGTFMVVREKP